MNCLSKYGKKRHISNLANFSPTPSPHIFLAQPPKPARSSSAPSSWVEKWLNQFAPKSLSGGSYPKSGKTDCITNLAPMLQGLKRLHPSFLHHQMKNRPIDQSHVYIFAPNKNVSGQQVITKRCGSLHTNLPPALQSLPA